ncbi:MAG: right-handed parallel beta-helix repeat-containing protein [Alphaproteobacteria bacterium]|nr:right-handed parallel beta-helix repeat-containing protein [Alphaproteobacteria bacterium]
MRRCWRRGAIKVAARSIVVLLAAAIWQAASPATAAPTRTGGPIGADSTSCGDLTRAHPGTPCHFDFTKFRFSDPRLDALESKGVEGSGLFNGTVHRAANAKEANAFFDKLQPGDQLVLADGIWADQRLLVRAEGTAEHPILVRAEHPGGVKFTGTSSGEVDGAYVIVQGISFVQGAVTKNDFVVFRMGDGPKKPCNQCIADRIAIDGYNSSPERYDTVKIFYLVLDGRDITVANSFFGNKENFGTMISPDLPEITDQCPQRADSGGDCFERLLFENNTVSGFSRNHHHDPDNGEYKLMQLGWSGISTHSAFSVLQGNTFEYADGANETISLKASDVIVRRNRFHASQGTLNLRSANRVLIENNVFDGDGKDSMGGVRIEAKDHWVVHNLFKNLVRPMDDYYWPVALHTASEEELTDNYEDYARVKDVVIADNLFDGDAEPAIAIGIYPNPKQKRVLLPTNIFILDNVFRAGRKADGNPAIAANAPPIYFEGGADLYRGVVVKGNERGSSRP